MTATATATMSAPSFLHDGWVEEYWDRGYTIFRGVFSKAEIAGLRERFDRTYEEGMRHHASWRHQNRVFWVQEHKEVGRFVSGCQWQSWADPKLDWLRTDPRILAMLEPLIGNDIKQITNQMHWKKPGTGYNWALHQDVRSRTPVHCFRELATSYVQTGVAIVRHWAGNGAMKVYPGSHRTGDLRRLAQSRKDGSLDSQDISKGGLDPASAIDVEMDPGDVVIWSPFTIHGGGVNSTSADSREFYINGYVKAPNCDRGQPVFHKGQPVPLTIPALIQYDDLYVRPEPHYPTDPKTILQRD